MAWTSLATGLLVLSLARPAEDPPARGRAEEPPSPPAAPPACLFPEAIDLTYHVHGKRRLPVPGGNGKDGVCHLVKHEASLHVHGLEGVVRVHDEGKKPPRGARLAACDEPFRILAADEPRAWHRCPGGEDGSVHRARIRPDRGELPEGYLTVVLCGSKVAKVEVDLGLRWKPCSLDYQVDEPPAEFAACAERLPPATSRRSATGAQALACRE